MSEATDLITDIERNFEQLKKDYTQFLGGLIKVEPYELKDDVMTKVKRLRNMNLIRTEERFRANNLLAKVQSHFTLWERQMERKFSGDKRAQKPKTAPPPKPKTEPKPEKKPVIINNVAGQREQVVALYDEYTKLNLLLGARKMVDFTKFQNFIRSQTQKIQKSRKVQKVGYEVLIQNQKVVIKSKSIKE